MIGYFKHWHAGQWVRLGFGTLFVLPGITQLEWALGAIGSIFFLQAFLNKDCSGGSCPLS